MNQKQNLGLQKANEKSHQLTRECICTALLTLMSHMPIDKITTTSIINRSGVSRAAFYRKYKSKEDVLTDIVSHFRNQMIKILDNPLFYKNPKKWLAHIFHLVQQDSVYYEVLKSGYISLELIIEDTSMLANENDAQVEQFNTKDMTSNDSIANDILEYRNMSQYSKLFIIYGLWGILTEWCRNEMKETPEEMAEITLRTIRF